jgi:hypothetical protein
MQRLAQSGTGGWPAQGCKCMSGATVTKDRLQGKRKALCPGKTYLQYLDGRDADLLVPSIVNPSGVWK